MDEEMLLELLKTRIPISASSESSANELVQVLEGIPLAISQAAAYIRTGPRVTIAAYLDLFRESEASKAYLLDYAKAGDIRRDPGVNNSVITTRQISFEQIRKIGRSAADLLSLMSLLDRVGIPGFLLMGNSSRVEFNEALAPLIDFSLVTASVSDSSFEMHWLVQFATRT